MLKPATVLHPGLSFFKILVSVWDPFRFQVNLKVVLSITKRYYWGIGRDSTDSKDCFGTMDILPVSNPTPSFLRKNPGATVSWLYGIMLRVVIMVTNILTFPTIFDRCGSALVQGAGGLSPSHPVSEFLIKRKCIWSEFWSFFPPSG